MAISLVRVLVPSLKKITNLLRTYTKINCKGEPYRLIGYGDPSVQRSSSIIIRIIFFFLQGMIAPCVMDIKIGAKTYGPTASAAKIAQEDAKYLGTKKPLGKNHD